MHPFAFSVTSPAPRDVWKDVLQASPEALLFQTPNWLNCICATGGYEGASRLYELAGGRQLVLPMVQRIGLPGRLATQASLPYRWGPGGVIAPGELTTEDVAIVLDDLARSGALHTSVRPNPLAAPWAAATAPGLVSVPRLYHELNLESGFDQIWAHRFTARARRSVRKAERAGVTVECDTSGRLVDVFYSLYRLSIDRWARQTGIPLHLARIREQRLESLRKYQIVAERLGQACRMYVAWWNGRAVATSIVLVHESHASYWRGAMDKDLAAPSQANFLLQQRAIEDACNAGCRYYHMGESGSSASLAHYKEAFGAEVAHCPEYHLERIPIIRLAEPVRRAVLEALAWGARSRNAAGRAVKPHGAGRRPVQRQVDD